MLAEEIGRELEANRPYLRRNLLFLGLGLGAIWLGGAIGARIGVTLLVWHGALALSLPVFKLLAREQRDARDLALTGGAERAPRAAARLIVLLTLTMPSVLLLATVFLWRVGRDAFESPLAAGVCLIVAGVLLVVVALGAVALLTRSVSLVLLTYAAAATLILLGMTPAGAALLPGVPLWISIATGTAWGFTVTLLWQCSCAVLLAAIVIDVCR